MNRELLEQMTKEELLELASRQNDAINSLDEQRYNASAVIDHLVSATHELHNLRYHDGERNVTQDRLDDWVREMYARHPLYIVPAEEVSKVEDWLKNPIDLWDDMKGKPLQKQAEREEKLPSRSDVIINLVAMRDKAKADGYDGYAKTLDRAIELLEEDKDDE